MADIDINDIAQFGVIKDQKSHTQPPEVWTEAYNMISKNKRMEAMKGWAQVFGTPLYAPHFAIPYRTQTESFWIYTSLTKAAIYDGSAHTDIVRASGGNYAAPNTKSWNGGVFAGIPFLNNGVDIPQFWAGPPVSNKLANLTNWPSTYRAKILRNYGAYLVAYNMTISGVSYPHLISWSSEAPAPGTLPSSWDASDETVDAGEYDLPDVESGVIVEAKLLGSTMMVYKETGIWKQKFIGGRAIFSFDNFSDTIGIMAANCVASTGDGKKHVVATLDDIVIHDGSSGPTSILENKMRSTVFNALDPTNYATSFMFRDLVNNNIIFAYPERGSTEPTRGLVFNYLNGAISECDIGFSFASSGTLIESTEGETWASSSGTWATESAPWNSFTRRAVLLCDKANTKFHRWDYGYDRDGVAYEAKLMRKSLGVIGRKRSGEWIEDFQKEKYVDRVWPKVNGGPVLVRLGYQQTVEGDIEWGPYFAFDPNNDLAADIQASGRAICIEFTTPEALEWSLDGYKLPIQVLSEF